MNIKAGDVWIAIDGNNPQSDLIWFFEIVQTIPVSRSGVRHIALKHLGGGLQEDFITMFDANGTEISPCPHGFVLDRRSKRKPRLSKLHGAHGQI